jgi:hypothetical protein
MLMAFTANSMGPDEHVRSAGFHEIGLFQTPAGPSDGPVTEAGGWNRIANSQEFEAIVGRRGYVGPNWQDAIEDQVVIGLIDYRNGRDMIARQIPSALRPRDNGSPWAVALGIMGYGYGPAAAAKITAHADTLSRVPESQRFGALLRAVAQDVQNGGGLTSYEKRTFIRAWQRFETAREVARQLGQSTAWYDIDLGNDLDGVEHILTAQFVGEIDNSCLQPRALATIGPEPSRLSDNTRKVIKGVAITAGIGLALYGAYYLYQRHSVSG